VHEEQILKITAMLGRLVLDPTKSDLRDVYTDGLRKLLKTVPLHMGDNVAMKLISELVDGIQKNSALVGLPSPPADKHQEKTAGDITVSCLEITTELLARFGGLPKITQKHESVVQVVLTQLSSESHMVRKRACNVLGCLSNVISDQLLYRLVESLLSRIELAEGVTRRSKRRKTRSVSSESTDMNVFMDSKPSDTRALIQTMCAISRMVGQRLGQVQIDRLVPIFLRFCDPSDAVSGNDADDADSEDMEDAEEDGSVDEAAMALANELRESCFTGFQSFVLRCPVEVRPHLPQIIHAALAYMRHDPNYSYDDENEDEADGDEDDINMDSDEEDYDDEDYDDDEDDDDDDSWKVRRSAVRTLIAVVQESKHDLSKVWIDEYSWKKNKKKKTTVAGALVNRFKEREENCRVDIINCFNRLLTNTVSGYAAGEVVLSSPDAMDTSGDISQVSIELGSKFVPAIVGACEKQLSAKKGGVPTKSAAFTLLSTLCTAPGGMGNANQVNSVLLHIKSTLNSSGGSGDGGQNSSKLLKLDALCLVRSIISCSHHDVVGLKNGLLKSLLPDICEAVKEHWYKVIAEALRVLTEIPPLLLASNSSDDEMMTVARVLYDSVEPRLAAHDLDQEIKECALGTSASLLSTLHGKLNSDQVNQLLSLILQRLNNESTRIAAIKAISVIVVDTSDGSDKLDLSPILNETVSELASLLRQNSRGVKQSALQCLDVIVQSQQGAKSDSKLHELILQEVSGNIRDTDLHICHLSLRLSLAVMEASSTCGAAINEHLLPALLTLSNSPCLQDLALDSLLAVLGKAVQSDAVIFQDLLVKLQNKEHGDSRQVIANLAKCIAAVTVSADESNRGMVISNILQSLESAEQNVYSTQLALRVSGDVGRVVDLSKLTGVTDKLQQAYFSSFDSPSDGVKNAAAYGLGRASVGATTTFLPVILSALEESNQKTRYLLLAALRELINCHKIGASGETDITLIVQQILPQLTLHCADKEEGVRTVVAECLGSLACVASDEVLTQLQGLATKQSVEEAIDADEEKNILVRSTVATSVKFAIAGHCDTVKLLPYMTTFLQLMKEEDLTVRNAALLMVYSAVHHNPKLVIGLMEDHIMPSLIELAQNKMQRKIDLGPFKHVVDDFLPLRKAAISIFATCLEKCPRTINFASFMPILTKALGDVEDVQLQAHQIVTSMCSKFPTEIVGSLEGFIAPLQKTLNKRMGNKTGTELERAMEWVKSALRIIFVLSRVEGAMNLQMFADFVERTRKSPTHQIMLKELEEVM